MHKGGALEEPHVCRHLSKVPGCSKNGFILMSLTLDPAILFIHYLLRAQLDRLKSSPQGLLLKGGSGGVILGVLPAAQDPLLALLVASPRSRL